MFTVSKTYEYDWPVIVEVPTDGGTFERREFTARFRVVPADRAEKLLGVQSMLSAPSNEQTVAFLKEAWVGWGDDVTTDDDPPKPIPFSDKQRDALLLIPFVRRAINKAYTESLTGAPEKN